MIKVKEESEKAGLKVNIKKTKIMEPCPFTSNRWGKMETVTDFIFLGSKVTADSDCSNEIKRLLVLGMEKAMATHSSTLAWKIPWAEEPGRLPSMGSLRFGHD